MHKTFVKAISLLTLLSNSHAESFKECRNAVEGTFVAMEKNCLAYVYCVGDESFTDLCPVGTYFDAQQQQCFIDEDGSKCTTSMAQPTKAVNPQNVLPQGQFENTATTTISTTTNGLLSTSTLSYRPQCKPNVDEYFPYQQRCEYYYRCTRGYLSILRCSLGYAWDFLQEKCMPLQEAQCFKVRRRQVFRF